MKNALRSLWPAKLRSGGYMHNLVRWRTGGVVHAGPFQGMRYIDESFCSALMPKLLGIYECELHGAIEELVVWAPDVIVDIGAAEGYYAVGLALRLPGSRIMAFEADEHARRLLSDLAACNGADNICEHGLAVPETMETVLANASAGKAVAVVSDCEGAEMDLLDPEKYPWLRHAFVICELHEFCRAGCDAEVPARFCKTHDITIIPTRSRHRTEFPFPTLMTRLFPNRWIQMALGESRLFPMSWMVARPK